MLTRKLNKNIIKLIRESLSAGHSYQIAARKAGTWKSTVHRWVKQATEIRAKIEADESYQPNDEELLLLEFLDAVDEGNGNYEALLLSDIKEYAHERKDMKAAQWLLEKRFPDEYGKREELNINHSNQPINEIKVHIVKAISDEQD